MEEPSCGGVWRLGTDEENKQTARQAAAFQAQQKGLSKQEQKEVENDFQKLFETAKEIIAKREEKKDGEKHEAKSDL